MTDYSVTEAKNRLPELIDRALAGEDVTITRHGQAVVEITAKAASAPKRVTLEDLAWLAERRKGRGRASVDAGTLVREMRDEEWR